MLERFFPDEYISSTYAIPLTDCTRRDTEESFSILTIPSFPTGPSRREGKAALSRSERAGIFVLSSFQQSGAACKDVQ